ncbi:MAG TPA: ATP-binding cassette domain-containing protein [Syntrophomonadaceae bacterium]|nr:ATP-binding cassette domain-containing protein [Syntrophomonadaceae bacterium]
MLILENINLAVNNNGESKEILRDINISFDPNKFYAITGPNGGGKTSIAKIIMGIYKPTTGSIYLNNENITDLEVSDRAEKGIAYAFQQPPRFKGLTVEDLLKIAQPDIDILTMRKTIRDVGLCPEEYLQRDLGPALSGGEMKRIEIAQILARNTGVSIFDEPEAGVDLWTIQRLIFTIMQNFKARKNSIAIVITHNENVLPMCDEVVVVEEGKIVAIGKPDEIWPLIREDIECKQRIDCQGDMQYETQ